MKRIFRVGALLLLSISTFQCEKKSEEGPSPDSNNINKELFVEPPEAQEIAVNFLKVRYNDALRNSANARTLSTLASDTTKKVKSTRTIKNKAGNSLMHVVSFKGEKRK